MKRSDIDSLDFAVNRFFMKLCRRVDTNFLNLANYVSPLTYPVCFLRTVQKFDMKY